MEPDAHSGVAYVVDVGPGDLGARVVLRARLPGGGATDVLGHLAAWSGGEVVVRTRTGEVRVAEAALLAAKRVPEAPPRRRAAGP